MKKKKVRITCGKRHVVKLYERKRERTVSGLYCAQKMVCVVGHSLAHRGGCLCSLEEIEVKDCSGIFLLTGKKYM